VCVSLYKIPNRDVVVVRVKCLCVGGEEGREVSPKIVYPGSRRVCIVVKCPKIEKKGGRGAEMIQDRGERLEFWPHTSTFSSRSISS